MPIADTVRKWIAGRFTVRAADGTNPRQRFHWEVKAVRADVERLVAEPEKRARELAGVG